MNQNDELITYGLQHGDPKVRELAERFDEYRRVVVRHVRMEVNSRYGKFAQSETSGQRAPMYDHNG